MSLALLDEAVGAGARLEKACGVLGLSVRTVTRWRTEGGEVDRRAATGSAPMHKLTAEERDARQATVATTTMTTSIMSWRAMRAGSISVFLRSEAYQFQSTCEAQNSARRRKSEPAAR